jgi:two-component system sensor histidine kinase PilS (NtrC family)
MMQLASLDDHSSSPRLLRLYASYRLFLSSLLLWLVQFDFAPTYLGSDNPSLFALTAAAYIGVNLVSLPLFYLKRWQPSETALFAMLLIDIIAINLMMHASGGLAGSVGYLLMVTVAASATFLRTQLALSMAAIASFIPVSVSLSEFLLYGADESGVVRSGIFGILLFATAVIFIFLTKRLTIVQELAKSESQAATRLQHLNDLVINKMLTGIVVFDREFRIEQLSERASLLLGSIDGEKLLARGDLLTRLPTLINYYRDWVANPHRQLPTYQAASSDIPLQISFSEIIGNTFHNNTHNNTHNSIRDTIMFVEDARTLSQHAQQLKNRSLGQLTSSIAHEVRNPLGAISHAAQLLNESTLTAQDKHLVDVVLRHSTRVDKLVKDILQLSRQKTPDIDITNIYDNCQLSKTQLEESVQFDNPCIEIDDSAQSVSAPFDSSQLQQVLINLLGNALRHSELQTGKPWAGIKFDYQQDMDLAMIKIYDHGTGVASENRNKIFEPFFTTENQGTGLGLYIARELCEINFATLSYVYRGPSDHYFQIVFSDPAKQLPRNAANEQNRSDH